MAQFSDTPVKRYSSGLYLRLAFAVAAHLEPEILVVDEGLAVGDAEFQRKCLGKMDDVAHEGRTVLFVSHNMSAILQLTQESILLEKGQLVRRGPSTEVVDHYLSAGFSQSGERRWEADEVPADAAPFTPVALRVRAPNGSPKPCFDLLMISSGRPDVPWAMIDPSKFTIKPSPMESNVPSEPDMHTFAVTMRLQNAFDWLVKRHASRIGAV